MQPVTTHPQPTLTELDRQRQQVHAEWMDPTTVDAWTRWHAHLTASFYRLTEALIARADLRPGQQVLDLACGTGEPALSIASRVGPGGLVVATDLSEGMVDAARANARRLGLENMDFHQADAEALPFPSASFDRVTSRLGAMFWPDAVQAQREIYRVLRPGGRVTELVWGSADRQLFFQSTLGVVQRHVDLPVPEAGAPGVFRFAEPGSLSSTLAEAGFHEVREERREVEVLWPGRPEELWTSFQEMAAPFRGVIASLSPEVRGRVDREVLETLSARLANGQIRLAAEVVIATAVR